jgi:hypothetical protein
MHTSYRYGKRSELSMSENTISETLRMILDNVRWQNEQRRQERIRQNKEPILFNDF